MNFYGCEIGVGVVAFSSLVSGLSAWLDPRDVPR